LAGYAAIKVIAPTFYAFGDSRTPMYVALFSIVVNIGLDYVFAVLLKMETAGLALSTSCVALVNFFLLLALMRRRIGRIEGRQLLIACLRITGAALAMTAVAYGVHTLLAFNRYLDVAGSMVVALLVFGAACKLLRVEEFGELLGVLRFNPAPAVVES